MDFDIQQTKLIILKIFMLVVMIFMVYSADTAL